jgi:prepilin-type N-terminal cleavage/methylation domain-containing protein
MRNRARSGMTLIELVVGLVVTGFIVAAGYAAFATVIDRRENAAQAAFETARASGTRRTLLRWLDGATVQVPEDFSDASIIDQLTVITRSATPMQSPQTSVRLFVDDGRSGFGRGLIAMLRPSVGNDSLPVTLDPDARDMRVQYLATIDGIRQWTTVDGLGQNQPVAVRLYIDSDAREMAVEFARPVEVPLVRAR